MEWFITAQTNQHSGEEKKEEEEKKELVGFKMLWAGHVPH